MYVDKEENGAFDTFCTKAMKETQHRLLTTTGARGDAGGGGGGKTARLLLGIFARTQRASLKSQRCSCNDPKQCCLCETGGASGVDDEIMDRVSDIRRQRQEQHARKQRRDEQSQRIARRLALAHAWFCLR